MSERLLSDVAEQAFDAYGQIMDTLLIFPGPARLEAIDRMAGLVVHYAWQMPEPEFALSLVSQVWESANMVTPFDYDPKFQAGDDHYTSGEDLLYLFYAERAAVSRQRGLPSTYPLLTSGLQRRAQFLASQKK